MGPGESRSLPRPTPSRRRRNSQASAGPTVGTGFWTHENRDDWPDLVRIGFTLNVGAFELRALPGGLGGKYEVVCRIGQ